MAERRRDVRFGESDLAGNKDCWATLAAGDAIRLDARLEFVVQLLLDEARLTGRAVNLPRGALRARALGLLADPHVVTALAERVKALRSGDAAGPVRETDLPATTVYVHLRRDELLEESPAAVAVEGTRRLGPCAVPYEAIEEVLGHSHITVKPVMDLAHMASGGGYAFLGEKREAVLLKSPTCVFPFCDRPARACQTDHSRPAPRGPTAVDNGGPLCLRHHRVKTHGRWRLLQPVNGIYLWVSPHGRVYLVDNRGTARLSDAA